MGVTVPRAPLRGFSHGTLASALPVASTSAAAALASARSSSDIVSALAFREAFVTAAACSPASRAIGAARGFLYIWADGTQAVTSTQPPGPPDARDGAD